jgi:predicted nucleotidyltransferase
MIESILKIITNKSLELGISVKSISLFGSRTKGEENINSDWDILIIVKDTLGFNEKWNFITAIQREIVSKRISLDLIVQSEQEAEIKSKDKGYICYYAAKEAVIL